MSFKTIELIVYIIGIEANIIQFKKMEPNNNNIQYINVNLNDLKKKIHKKEDIIKASRELG